MFGTCSHVSNMGNGRGASPSRMASLPRRRWRALGCRIVSADDRCSTPFGDFELHRGPYGRAEPLRAWDGADLLLLDHVAALGLDSAARVLVIGDRFGALSVALNGFDPLVWCDSAVSEGAITANRSLAGRARPGRFVTSLADAVAAGPFELIVWNVERATDLVGYVASHLGAMSLAGTAVFAAGMDKNLPPRTAEILRLVGDVTTHPGRRKAHLFEARVSAGLAQFRPLVQPPQPTVAVPEHGLQLHGGPGVFSADRFDLGTRLLAGFMATQGEFEPGGQPVSQVVDLGCGAGALGVIALRTWPEAAVHFVDDCAMAVATAQINVRANIANADDQVRATFLRTDVLTGFGDQAVDLIVCNPPFHHGNAMTDDVAWQMFLQSREHVRAGGEFWVVGNRHLGYHAKLTRLFGKGHVRQLVSHPKFVVLGARR